MDKKTKQKYNNYSTEALHEALALIDNNTLGVWDASKRFSIPYDTLVRKIKNEGTKKRGVATTLTEVEEASIVNWIEDCAKLGFPVTKKEVVEAARKIAMTHKNGSKVFGESGPSNCWYSAFRKRHSSLQFRKPEPVTKAAANVTSKNISDYFEKLSRYFTDNDLQELFDRPEAWFNLDESSLDLNVPPGKVLKTINVRHTYRVEHSNHRERVTVTMCVCADGSFLPTQVIFPQAFSRLVDAAYAAGEEGAKLEFSMSERGWQDKGSYLPYIKKLDKAIEDAGIRRPVVLVVDGYKTHKDFEIYEYCKSRDIIYVVLYPNATHILQPLDVTVFKSLKAKYKEEVQSYLSQQVAGTLKLLRFR